MLIKVGQISYALKKHCSVLSSQVEHADCQDVTLVNTYFRGHLHVGSVDREDGQHNVHNRLKLEMP